MQRGVSYLICKLSQVSGRVYLIIAVLIFAAANSVTRKLTDLGALHLIEGRNPFSFCNILFVGNICAFFTLWVVYRQQLSKSNFRQLSYKNWFGLIGVSIFAGVLAPSLIFLALERTAVNNVILIGRIETFIILALSVFILKDRVNFWGVGGSMVSFIGVMLTIFLQSPSGNEINMGGFQIGPGELMTGAAALASAVANIISRVTLEQVSLGFFNLVKTVLSTIVFFMVVLKLFGTQHFIDVFYPALWQWMFIYGAVIVVGGQLCWFAGLKRTTGSEVALASSFYPLAGVIAAYLILGEAPTMAQYVGGIVILIGIILSVLGERYRQPETKNRPISSAQQEVDKETEMGFRGI